MSAATCVTSTVGASSCIPVMKCRDTFFVPFFDKSDNTHFCIHFMHFFAYVFEIIPCL